MTTHRLKDSDPQQTPDNIGALQVEEEKRRQAEERASRRMGDTEYREHLHARYGENRWADHLVDELAQRHEQSTTQERAESRGEHTKPKPN